MKPNQDSTAPKSTETTPTSQEGLRHLYWYGRAADCVTGGQIYLQGNPRMREPPRPEHTKPRLLGQLYLCTSAAPDSGHGGRE